MIFQPNRLPGDAAHGFSGDEIDRKKPLRIRLDGRSINGYAGDTVLSAALASGLIAAGTRKGNPLALDERFAPPVLPRGKGSDAAQALPMERTPAVDGLDLVTLPRARHGRFRRLLDGAVSLWPGRGDRLGLSYDSDVALGAPWLDVEAVQQLDADLAVVGGGLAGMGAAIAAARRGQRVVLVERRQSLGGAARFFGGTESDDPEEMIARLAKVIAELASLTVLLNAEAFALFEGVVKVHQVALEDGQPAGRVLTVSAPRVVVANGAIERLPIFAGNRRPGIVGALAAFDRARRYGVWIGRRALLGTSTSIVYRLATQAKDAGVAVERIADVRLNAQSRFIEFSKAHGIPLIRATRPLLAEAADRAGRGLKVHLDSSFGGAELKAQQFEVDQLVVAGGWQPDLGLWHMAGGSSRWNAAAGRLEAEGTLPGIALAGAVAGYRNASACLKSGEAATALLFGRSPRAVDDTQIDPIHESPDDPTSIAPFDPKAHESAYLDGGGSLAMRPAPEAKRGFRLLLRRQPAGFGFGDQVRPLSVADVAASVQLGLIPPADAAIVAQERGLSPGNLGEAGHRSGVPSPAAATGTTVPPYLAGRFGPRMQVWQVEANDGRRFEVGCLVFANAEKAEPLAAIGVVFARAPERRAGGMAVVGSTSAKAGDALMVRDISGPIPVLLVDPAAPDKAPAAPAASVGDAQPAATVAVEAPAQPAAIIPAVAVGTGVAAIVAIVANGPVAAAGHPPHEPQVVTAVPEPEPPADLAGSSPDIGQPADVPEPHSGSDPPMAADGEQREGARSGLVAAPFRAAEAVEDESGSA